MLFKKLFTKVVKLTILTIGLSALQSLLLHIGTTDYAHNYSSFYFFAEIFILILTIVTGLQRRIDALLFLIAFIIEAFWFLRNERPFSPDVLLMFITGAIRLYIIILLIKNLIIKPGIHE